jgi:hypothetical protein
MDKLYHLFMKQRNPLNFLDRFSLLRTSFSSGLMALCLVFLTLAAEAQQVTNTNTNAVFTTIQAAIDAPATLDNHTLVVSAGTYTEAINISKALTITGPNAGVPGTTVRGTEAILSDGSINVSSSGTVILDGFHIYQTNGTSTAILLGGSATATIKNSKIERVANTAGQGVIAIEISSGSGAKTIQNNLFTGSTSGGLFSGHKTWNNGLYVNAATSTIAILGNTFENIRSAVNVDDYNAGVNMSGNSFKVNGTDISFGGSSPTAGAQTLGSNDFVFPADGIINLSNVSTTFRLDMSSSTFGGAPFSTLSLDNLFLVEARMYHRGRNSRKGLVYYVSGNEYVAPSLTSIQSAVDYGSPGDIINIDNGTYNEDISINTSSLTLQGRSGAGTIIKGLYAGAANTVLIAATNVTLKRLTITRDYQDWFGSTKNQGVNINAAANGATLDELIVKDNRNGIYINNAQNITVKNCIIEANRTGLHYANNISGAIAQNNLIRDNFTHGLLFNYDTPPGIVATNVKINNNSITGNWYAQVNFQHNNNAVPETNDHTGLSFSCNWYGTTTIGIVAANAAEPGYDTQTPSQKGGSNPGLNRQLYGLAIAKCPAQAYLNSGTDNDLGMEGFQPVPNSCIYPVKNITHFKEFTTIQDAINDPITVENDVIQLNPGIFTETFTVTKSLNFQGANAAKCGTDNSREAETILTAPPTYSSRLITLSGAVSAVFKGFLIDGTSIANVTQSNQNLEFENSVFELDFLPASANLYFNANTLSLKCNYFKAIAGSDDGGASHIFFNGAALTATGNKFTSETGRSSMNPTTTHTLPVWFNITDNANNVNIDHNLFFKIDIGILLASNAGNVKIENNEFQEAKRETIANGIGYGAGIALFGNLTPAAPILIRYNKFFSSEAGIRTAGTSTNFPAPNLLTISYNSFENLLDKAIRIGSYGSGVPKLNAPCNWYGAVTGPITTENGGASGLQILDPTNKVLFRNWLIYGTDTDAGQLGLQLPTAISVSPGNNTSVAENHYRILSNAVGCAMTGQTITLSGTFDYTNSIAKGEWAKGNDGESQGAASAFYAASGDDYSILAPARTENVTLTSASPGSATIEGPGEIATTALESFLFFNSNTATSSFKGWTISNLKIKNFDASIGADHNQGSISVMENFKILNNEFLIPADLNKTQEADNFQNIGIHLNYGKNQEVKNNKFIVDGTGVSDGTTSYSTSVVLQSATSGGDAYDGLKIQNNEVHVTGAPNVGNPARIVGFWENSNSQASAIDISGNTFVNDDADNKPQNNRQLAFRVTSFSGDASHQIVYQNNEISGFNRGIEWIGDPFSSYTPNPYLSGTNPVIVQNNKIDNVVYGVTVRKDPGSANTGSPAVINNNSFTNIYAGGYAIGNTSGGTTNASCNWYSEPLTALVISNTGPGSITYLPKLSAGTDDNAATGFQVNPSNGCVLPVLNVNTNATYLTIQEAVDNAGNNHVIQVSKGIYPENVVVNKPLTIYGVDSVLVILDKNAYGAAAGAGFNVTANNVTLKTMKIRNYNFGVTNSVAIESLTLESLTLVDNFGAGFYTNQHLKGLTVTKSTLNTNGYKGGSVSGSPYKRGIMLQSTAADYSDLVFTDNVVTSNGLTGIDVNGNHLANGVTITGNNVKGNVDAQISVWLGKTTPSSKPVLIENNQLELFGNSRYGIELKNMSGTGSESGTGSIVVKANQIKVAAGHLGSDRDMAGIGVLRRKDNLNDINDQPQGVVILNNTISDFQNSGEGDAFGVVLGGTGHKVSGNTISNTQYAIQLQKGNENYNNDNNSSSVGGQTNNAFFDRDNSNDVCVEIDANTITGAVENVRLVTGASTSTNAIPPVRVTNNDLSSKFCTIQQAINFMATSTGHVLEAVASDYPENVVINKSVTLQGPNKTVAGSGARAAEASIIPPTDDIANGILVKILANDVTIKGFAIDGANSSITSTVLINGAKTQAAYGVKAVGQFTGLMVLNNIFRNISKHGVDLDAENGSTKGNAVSNNWFDNLPRYHGDGFYGRGVLLANNFYASVTGNKFTRVERAIQTNNFSKAILDGNWEIKDNDITAYNIGAFINLHYQATTDLAFENNTIDKDATTRTITSGTGDPLPDSDFTGVEAFSIADAVKVTLKGGVIKNAASGIYSWNNSSSNHVTIDGVSFLANSVAVLQSNFSRYSGAIDSEIDVKNVTITNGSTVKAFVAEDHNSGSGAMSSINLVSGNVITSSGTFTHPFHLQGKTKARIKAGGSSVTLSTEDAFTFNVTGTSTTANVVIKEGLTVNLAGNNKRVVNLPAGLILQMDGDFTAPNKVTDNPVLINGALWFNSGILNSGDGSIEFGNTASDILTGTSPEKSTSYILGKALMASRNVGGAAIDMLGVKMADGPTVGNLVIIRTTKASGSVTPAFPADASIRTVWEITPSISSASRGDVQFRYLNLAANINSQNPAAIYAYRYNSGNSKWEKKSALRSSTNVADVYTTQTFGIAEFSSWTLSSSEPAIGVDFTITIPRPSGTSLAKNVASDGVFSISNISPNTSSGPVVFYIEIGAGYEISFDENLTGTYAGLNVDNTQWTIVQNGVNLRSYTLTSKPAVTWTGGTAKRVGYKIKGVGTPSSAGTIVGELESNTGGSNPSVGDYDFANDIGVRSFVIIP